MVYVIAQLSDVHIGSPNEGSGERLSAAIAEINAMGRQPDLVLLTGDNTHGGADAEWQEFNDRLNALSARWVAIGGNHDRGIEATTGHRSMETGPLHLVLLDTSDDTFDEADEEWLASDLSGHTDTPTVIAIHQPPFETGIWWMDCVGLKGAEKFESVVRRNHQVIQVLSGHVHRPIQTNWGSCSLWVSPSTSVSVAADIDPNHEPAETAEPPSFSLHAFTGTAFVSHLVPVGSAAERFPIRENAPEFIDWVREEQRSRPSAFGRPQHGGVR